MQHCCHIIHATRCHNLMLKCTKFDFGSAPDPTGGAYSAHPDPPSWIKGVLLLRGREGKGEGKDRGGERREGGEGRGEEGGKKEGEGQGGGGPSGDVADQAFCLKSAPAPSRLDVKHVCFSLITISAGCT